MAKIYETKEDFQKDVLEQQAKDLRLKSSEQSGTGAALISTNFFIDMWQARRGGGSGLIALASSLLGIVGVVKIVKSFFTSHKAHSLELERERLGPATTVFPPGTLPPGVSLPPGQVMPNAIWQETVASTNGQPIIQELSLRKDLEANAAANNKAGCGCKHKQHLEAGPTSLIEQATRQDGPLTRQ